ncbi:MAG: polysaccharide biosynthesis C-terminal domain-containing protein, partial [Thermodesulfobacteriota bacterium]|nr:polysaccharide biosynthesis C-terminal domain-containing protein [Thermodesulfobacteriota bacterium]
AEKFEQKKIIQFALPVLSFFICISILSYLDLFFVKALLNNPAKTGYYTAAQTISRLISFAMFPFGIVLLPTISSAIAKNDLNMVRRYIDGSLRYILIILIPTCMLLSITAKQLLIHVYGPEYAFGATSLSILFFGASCWGITNAMVAIIQGYGQPGRPAMIFAVMIPVDIILIQIFIRKFGVEGAAVATTCTFITGMILAAITIYKRYAVLINIRAVLKILIASFVACSQFIFIKPSGFLLLFCYILAFCIYFGVLRLLGELKREDMDLLANAIYHRRSRAGIVKE